MSTKQSSTVGVAGSTTTDHPPAGSKKFSSQSGGRSKGGSRGPSKAHSNHGPPSEEPMQASGPRKKALTNHKDKDTKSRPPTQQRMPREGSKVGGARGKSSAETGHSHHRPRDGGGHRTGSSTSLDGFGSGNAGGKAEARILSSNRFEKLEIDPDSGASLGSSTSGENLSVSKSSSSSISPPLNSTAGSKGAEDRKPAKERSNRSGRGSFRGRGSTKFQPDSEDGGRPSGHVNGSALQKEENKGTQKGGEDRKRSPKQIRFDLPSSGALNMKEQDLEQGEVGEPAVVVMEGSPPSTTGVKSEGAVDSVGVDSTGDAPLEASSVETDASPQKTARIVYDRDFLLAVKTRSHSFPPPPGLVDLMPQSQSSSAFATDHPFKKDSSSAEESKPMKHPTALTLIKEHDKHFVGKVSLSPQRGSFQRGCSWKERVSNSDVSQNSSDASLKTPPPKFSCSDGQGDPSYFKFEGQKSQGRPSGPRVINHVPIRDQEQRQAGKKGGWRGGFREEYVEPEPEWMEFGPTDRFDVIELKGFEEHEERREDGADPKDGSPAEEPAGGSCQPDRPSSPVEKGEKPEKSTEEPKPQAASTAPSKQQEEENEFILDGFDFSTGVSICQALDLDEDEPTTTDKGSLLLPKKGVTDPSELGSVLLKALGVNKGATGDGSMAAPPFSATSTNTGIDSQVVSSAPPANALTLDEIHAREDIHPGPAQAPKDTASVGEGMEAFNKLLAVLESKKPPSQKENFSPPSQGYQDPVHPILQQQQQQRTRVPRPSSYGGYPLDKELLNFEEDHMAFPEPNLRRLEQLERMLETMDRMDPTRMDTATAQHYDFHPMAAPQASLPPPPHRLHQMDQRVPMQMDREGRGWMYPQEPRGRALPTPQQLAAARQHQMLTNARGGANNWAVEMEQRRLIELRQMQLAKENEMYGGATPTGGIPPPQGYKASHPSKPNISLLPTAVMRHMHTNKPGQAGTDLPKTTSISNRLDQDLTNKASQTHSVLNSLLNQSQEFSGHHHHHPHPSDFTAVHPHHPHRVLPTASMRMPPHTAPKPSDVSPSGSVYPHYNLPHGMPPPLHNPYMY